MDDKQELLKWLHISDIHYMIDSKNNRIISKVKEAISKFTKENQEKVDCVIITGDFFLKGEIPNGNGDNLIVNCVEEICDICLRDEVKTFWKKRVLFCPGNHDLIREAFHLQKEGQNVKHRKDLLQKICKDGNGRIDCREDSADYELLTIKSFELFDREITNKFREESKPFGEYTIFSVPDKIGSEVCFIGLNTALCAGQIPDRKEREKKLEESRAAFERVGGAAIEYEKAEEAYRTYLDCYRRLILNEADDDAHDGQYGHLSFISQKSVDEIERSINDVKNNYSCSVVFGHHPISSFSEEGQRHFYNAIKDWGTTLYLCGHEHRPGVTKESILFNNREIESIKEIKVGGAFSDEGSWNIPSFAVCTLYKGSSTDNVSIEGKVIFRHKYCSDGNDAIIQNENWHKFPDNISSLNQTQIINKDNIEGNWNRTWKAFMFEIPNVGKCTRSSTDEISSLMPKNPIEEKQDKVNNTQPYMNNMKNPIDNNMKKLIDKKSKSYVDGKYDKFRRLKF